MERERNRTDFVRDFRRQQFRRRHGCRWRNQRHSGLSRSCHCWFQGLPGGESRRASAAIWPSWTRPFRPTTAPCEFSSPKLVEVGRHPNIEVLTYTEVDSVEGEAGDFTVTLVKKPRYIIEEQMHGLHHSAWNTARSNIPISSTRRFRRIRPSTYTSPRRFRWSRISMRAAFI